MKAGKKNGRGETILFNKFGLIPKVFIEPKPNRLVLFIHSNQSFHGVNTILCPSKTTRNTYYMDYYINRKDINKLNDNLKSLGLKNKLFYTYHPTTFIPFFPLGIRSFTFGRLIDNIHYLRSLFIYLLFSSRLISHFRFKYFSQIRGIKNFIISLIRPE